MAKSGNEKRIRLRLIRGKTLSEYRERRCAWCSGSGWYRSLLEVGAGNWKSSFADRPTAEKLSDDTAKCKLVEGSSICLYGTSLSDTDILLLPLQSSSPPSFIYHYLKNKSAIHVGCVMKHAPKNRKHNKILKFKIKCCIMSQQISGGSSPPKLGVQCSKPLCGLLGCTSLHISIRSPHRWH